MIRVATYPAVECVNPYLALLYRALVPHGIVVTGTAELNDSYLRNHAGEFDVLHLHWTHHLLWRRNGGALTAARGLAGAWRFLRLARRLGKRIVWTVHDLEHLDEPERSDWFGSAILGRMADLVVCHAETTRDRLARRYRVPRRSMVVMPIGNYDGVYPHPRSRAEVFARLGLDPNKRTLVGFGLVRTYKGFDVAVDAARALGSEYQLVVAGNVPRAFPEVRADLERRAASSPNIRLDLREVEDADLADLYSIADCVLLPYRRITGSAALLTALTLGRGVVASDLPFFREELAPEPNAGVLVPPNDPTALADGVRRFFDADVAARHAAARQLAANRPWSKVVLPVAERMLAFRP